MINCATCGQAKDQHSATEPHPSITTAQQNCAGFETPWPCRNCGADCVDHEPDAPHPCIETDCPGAEPPENWNPGHPEGGGGSFGGGGASGGWAA